jgi:hypothetical protein
MVEANAGPSKPIVEWPLFTRGAAFTHQGVEVLRTRPTGIRGRLLWWI